MPNTARNPRERESPTIWARLSAVILLSPCVVVVETEEEAQVGGQERETTRIDQSDHAEGKGSGFEQFSHSGSPESWPGRQTGAGGQVRCSAMSSRSLSSVERAGPHTFDGAVSADEDGSGHRCRFEMGERALDVALEHGCVGDAGVSVISERHESVTLSRLTPRNMTSSVVSW